MRVRQHRGRRSVAPPVRPLWPADLRFVLAVLRVNRHPSEADYCVTVAKLHEVMGNLNVRTSRSAVHRDMGQRAEQRIRSPWMPSRRAMQDGGGNARRPTSGSTAPTATRLRTFISLGDSPEGSAK